MKKDSETVYVYTGDGLGIPGLPNRVTRAEAVAMQAERELDEAIAFGVYVFEKAEIAPEKSTGVSAPLKNAARTVQTNGTGSDIKKNETPENSSGARE